MSLATLLVMRFTEIGFVSVSCEPSLSLKTSLKTWFERTIIDWSFVAYMGGGCSKERRINKIEEFVNEEVWEIVMNENIKLKFIL